MNMNHFLILIKWLFIYFFVIIVFKKYQPPFIYLFISFCFLTGFILRKFNLYPGKEEPLILDFLTFLISLLFFILLKFGFKIDLKISFFIILLPHLIYNLLKILK
jgi:hypothetical protein